MGELCQQLAVIFVIYTARAILCFANYRIAFDKYFDFPALKWKKTNWIWIGLYVFIMYMYRPMINYGPRSLRNVVLIIYLVRIVPFLWARYGFRPIYPVIVLFYGSTVDSIAQNIGFLFFGNLRNGIYANFMADISTLITELLVFAFIMVMLFLERAKAIRLCFTRLTIGEYVILFLANMSYAILEGNIFRLNSSNKYMIAFSIATFIFLMAVIMHVILVRDQNTSMNNMIGNLKEPMKEITASYIEMNEKNTELRRFRHDTKNLLLVLHSLLEEGKTKQAAEFINKMQETMQSSQHKAYDTGNFIADALLEYKGKVAAQKGITMTFEGCIPSSRVEDVNLVILISNLLDNAIDAAKKVDGEKKIEIESILKKNIWILSVKNSCIDDVVIRNNRIETTKENKEAHGFGLLNIERVTQKYSGNLQLSCENYVFVARATLMLTA
ncbi:MAG: GHKL domain-containing protein [Butyrivibrio sp.]|nr:GHKL domain-containing protein [Butyrivibrio sp.]